MKPVSELLKRHDGTLWHVTPDMTVYAAVETLARLDAGALLVMDGDRLAGVFSERDYTRTRECMSLMSARRIRHLPVVEGERVLGMISIRDIMDDIIADHEHTIASLESYIQS
jgi:CBS domain-containing protein